MINGPYVLFTRIPIVRGLNGRFFCDSLWAKDLQLHLGYIEGFGICCPVEDCNDTEGLTDISEYGIAIFFLLKPDRGLKSVLCNLLSNFSVVKKAVKHAGVVHSGGAGWAFPLSFYILLLRPFYSFRWVIVIESSFWMLERNERRTFRKIIEHYVHKMILTRCVKVADARIFTQSFYREFFLGDTKVRTLINPATWIDQENIVSPQAVTNRFERRLAGALNIIYPSRLVRNKGVLVVLEAIKKLQGCKVNITIMGAGELAEDCKRFASENHGPSVCVTYKESVDYGAGFLEILAKYDFVLIPSMKQEQPRIIFDAFSQGVSIIGSDTSGIRDITDASNAFTFKMGDSSSLADVIVSLAQDPFIALPMGLSGLSYVTGKTHLQMHKDRKIFLSGVL